MTAQSAPAPAPLDPSTVLEQSQALGRHWLDRFRSECEFATGLAAALPKESGAWTALIEKARAQVGAAAAGDATAIKNAVLAAEKELAPIATVAKTFTLSCAGHAHIDMNWLWGWQETVAVTVDTFETVLALMEEFPAFTFTQSQASVYEIVREHHAELFARIQAKVKEGRWEIAASHWVEGDKNLASGESLCRHLLLTRAFMKEHFALEPEDITVDWSPDTFGHAHTLPSIDARGGVKHYYMCRSGDSSRPPVFWWEGPDGERVLVSKEILWYNSEIRPGSTQKLLEFFGKTGSREWLQVYGVGDHGGGPTRRDLRMLSEMDSWPVYPRLRFSTVKRFFQHLETLKDLPVLKHELNYEFSGCYTSQSSIKKANRIGEGLMSEADAIAGLAKAAINRPVPGKVLVQAWRDVLFSHFHDILPGSGIRQTREYNSAMLQKIQAAGGQVRTQSMRALARTIDTSAGGRFTAPARPQLPEHESMALGAGAGRAAGEVSLASVVADGPRAAVVFNPTGFTRLELARATVWDLDTGPNPKPMRDRSYLVRLPDGTVLPAQRVGDGNYWGHNYADLTFPVQVGAYGWSTVLIEEGTPPAAPWKVWAKKESESGVNLATGKIELENELVKVAFCRRTGGITSLLLKAGGIEFADPAHPLGVLELIQERPVGMSAWILGDVASRRDLELESVEVVHWGPHMAAVQAKVKVSADSKFTVTYELHAGSPAVVVHVDGWWLEKGRQDLGIPRLALRVPTAIPSPQARYEIPYGSVLREEPSGREVPAQRWAHLGGTIGQARAGLTVLNDCKYGHSLEGSTLRISIVRSSYEPDPLPEIGQQVARFAIVPGAGDCVVADAIRLGMAFNHPLNVLIAPVHGGKLPAASEAIGVEGAGVVLTQLKWSEDGEALVLRLLETAGKATTAKLSPSKELLGTPVSVTESDVLERALPANAARIQGGVVEVAMKPHAISTLRLQLKRG